MLNMYSIAAGLIVIRIEYNQTFANQLVAVVVFYNYLAAVCCHAVSRHAISNVAIIKWPDGINIAVQPTNSGSQNLVSAWRIRMMRGASRVNIGMWLHQKKRLWRFSA